MRRAPCGRVQHRKRQNSRCSPDRRQLRRETRGATPEMRMGEECICQHVAGHALRLSAQSRARWCSPSWRMGRYRPDDDTSRSCRSAAVRHAANRRRERLACASSAPSPCSPSLRSRVAALPCRQHVIERRSDERAGRDVFADSVAGKGDNRPRRAPASSADAKFQQASFAAGRGSP